MKKRLIGSILAVCMVIGMIAGCGSGDSGSSDIQESGSSDGSMKVTMILSDRDEWLSEMESGALAAAEEMGVDLVTQDAQKDVSRMLQFIETARNDGQEVVIVNLVDPETGAECIEAAGDMKVVFVNRFPTDTDLLNENAVFVGSDDNEAGDLQAEYLAERFGEEGKTDIKYILLSGNYGLTATTLRTESVLKGLSDRGINAEEATAPLVADYNRAEAQDMIAPLLETTEFDCIIANNDSMALGAIEAMVAIGMDPASVPIVGIDASTDGRKSIAQGELGMSAFQNAIGQGSASVLAAKNMLAGDPIDTDSEYSVDEENEFMIWVPYERVDASNVADYD